MKHLKKLYAVAMAVVMAMVLSVTAYAAAAKTIEIKLPADSEEQTYEYKIYKVFDATSDGSSDAISYKLVSGKTTAPTGFTVDSAGNVTYTGAGVNGELTTADIAAIAAYVGDSDLVATVRGKANAAGNATVTATLDDYGFYYITTSTGSVVTIDSTNPGASVIDKNTVPTVDKKITGASSVDDDGKKALAQVGTSVEYTATISVGAGSKNLIFHDTMSAGLHYNGDATVTGTDGYTILETPYTDDTITITFSDGIPAGTQITVVYSATVTSDALQTDPATNTAKVTYGNESSYSSKTTSTEVYNAEFSVIKFDGDKENEKHLAGAGFVIANAQGTQVKYYSIANGVVTWVDSIDDATEYISGEDGALSGKFTGLANGTYTLIEKTVPAGYNKAADSNFTVAEHDYKSSNLIQVAEVENNAGTELPSTGGIGTTLFYVIGGILVAGAAIALVVKNRVAKIEE